MYQNGLTNTQSLGDQAVSSSTIDFFLITRDPDDQDRDAERSSLSAARMHTTQCSCGMHAAAQMSVLRSSPKTSIPYTAKPL